MATSVNRQVNIYIQSGEAEKAYDRLIAKETKLKEELKKATDPADVKRLTNELKKLEEPIDRAGKKLKGELNPNIRELKNTISQLQKQLSVQGIGDKEFTRLSIAVRKAQVELAEANRRAAELGNPQGGFAKMGAGMRSFLSGVGIGLGLELFNQASAAVSDFFGGAIDEALEAQRTVNNLKQTLAASGQEEYFDRIIAKADEMAERFKFLDNDDVTGVFSSLINYGKLTENQINKLIPVIVDFYSKQQLAGNTSFTLAESASVLVKAMEGNAKALKEYGINIKEGKDETERFNIIMDELAPKVKDAGDAFANDLTGQVAIARQEIKNMQEDIGNDLIPVWEKLKVGFLSGIKGLIQGFKDLRKSVKETFFMSGDEVKDQRKREAEDQLQKQMEDYATSFVNAESMKPIEQQRKSLEAQRALLEASRKEFEKLEALGKAYTADGINTYRELQKSELLVAKMEQSIKTQTSKEKLGTGTGTGSNKAAQTNDLDKVLEELKRKTQELNLYNANQLTKDLLRMNEYYDKLITRAGNNKQLLAEIADLRGREEALIIQKYRDQWEKEEIEANKRASKAKLEEQEKLEKARMQKLLQSQAAIAAAVVESGAKAVGNHRAALELEILRSNGKARLNAQLDLLNLEEQQELAKTDQTEIQKELIREKFRQKRKQLEDEEWQRQLAAILEVAQQFLGQFSNISSLMSQQENQRLEEDRARNEKKKENFKKQLDAKLISQKEYDKKVGDLEKQQEAREKQIKIRQFNRDKALNLVQATINGIQATVKALADGGPVYAAVVGALAAVQIAMIASQKPPKFAKGGYLPGPTHAEGGMPVINPRTGRKVAEVEGGEVILSRNTVRNNPHLVNQLLQSSMYRGGATINPQWRNASPSYLNIPMINSGIQRVRMFENGGVMPKDTAGASVDNEVILALATSIERLNAQINGGIKAYTLISENERQQNRLDNIRKDATMS